MRSASCLHIRNTCGSEGSDWSFSLVVAKCMWPGASRFPKRWHGTIKHCPFQPAMNPFIGTWWETITDSDLRSFILVLIDFSSKISPSIWWHRPEGCYTLAVNRCLQVLSIFFLCICWHQAKQLLSVASFLCQILKIKSLLSSSPLLSPSLPLPHLSLILVACSLCLRSLSSPSFPLRGAHWGTPCAGHSY